MTQQAPAADIWSEFARGRNPELWEQLAPEFERLARSVATLFARTRYEQEALFRVALVTLVKALDRYQPSAGKTFAEFAAPLLLTEIRKHQYSDRAALGVQQRLRAARCYPVVH